MAAPPGTFPPGMVPPPAEGTFPPGMVPPGASPQRPPPPSYPPSFPQGYPQPPPAYPTGAAPQHQASPQPYGYAGSPQPAAAYYPQPLGYPPTPTYGAYPAVYYPGYAAVGRGMVLAGYPYTIVRPPIPASAISMPPPPKGVPAPILPTPPTVEKKTSVYVGKIPLGVKDETIKSLLEKCGTIVSWKRVEDVETKQPKGFGFCEYEKAEHVMRALRLLNGFFLGPTALLLKVDSKTQAYLDDFLVRKKAILKAARANAAVAPGAPPPPPVEDQDEALEAEFQQTMLDEDARVQAAIKTVIDELIIDGTMALIEEKNSVPEPASARTPAGTTEEKEEGEAERSPERREDGRRDRDRDRERDRPRDRSRDRGNRERDRRDRRSRSRSRDRDQRDRREREPKDRDYRERTDRAETKKEQAPLKDNTSALASDFLASLETPSLQSPAPPAATPAPRPAPTPRAPPAESSPAPAPTVRLPPPPVEKPTPPPPQPWPQPPPVATPTPAPPPKKVPSQAVSTPVPVPIAFFNEDEDDEREKAGRKRTRPERIDYGEHALEADKKAIAATAKSIIDRIPTETDALFAFPINWEIYDEKKVGEERMRPWVAKKVKEYLGEEEKSLVNYILRMLGEHRAPSDILTEVEAILDSDGPVFVVKLWRMLIFEVLRADSGLVLS